jgi:hypothetical protein
MRSTLFLRRMAVTAGGGALAVMGVLAGAQTSMAAPSDPAPAPTPASTATTAPSYAPTNPVDCTDPNNVINCQSPPIDSPLVVGTAAPGSPYRD